MKQIVFTYEGFRNTNIGDYIQSLAAKQFSVTNQKKDIEFWHRDDLGLYQGNPVFAIMNGWYTHREDNWPPSEAIDPLFVSVHFNSSAYRTLLSKSSIDYLKRHEPIGCRDEATATILKEHGVKAYFSSCLTTTLGYKYGTKDDSKREGVYIVDPVHYVPEQNGRFRKYLFIPHYLRYKKGIDRYIKNLLENNPYSDTWRDNRLNVLAQSTRSYVVLRKILGKRALNKATIITQYHLASEIPTEQHRFERAEELLNKYRSARLVITSRIHCALPCLGLNTPTIFLKNLDDSEESFCRFGGLLNLLNVIELRKNQIVNTPFLIPLQIGQIHNKRNYLVYAESLISKCRDFVARHS